MSVLWQLQPATAAKHRLYRRYLDAWWPILLQPQPPHGRLRKRVTYLDAFAGPGRYTGGEEGSPVFALRSVLQHTATDRMHLSRDRVRLLFMERDPGVCAHLGEELRRKFGDLEKLPVRADVRRAEAGTAAEGWLEETRAWGHPILAVFDSWGNVNVPLSLMARLAHNPSSEVIVTFGPNWFSRQEKRQPRVLDMVFGGREYWEPAEQETNSNERWRVWLFTYRAALARAGFRYQLHFCIVPRTGQPLYLVYGTGHPSGVGAMKDAMWKVDGNDGMGFQDPRTRDAPGPGQMSLFAGGVGNPELLELVQQRLQASPVSLKELGRWLLTETARWLPKHARQAVTDLQDSGAVSVTPAGRVTQASVIRLR